MNAQSITPENPLEGSQVRESDRPSLRTALERLTRMAAQVCDASSAFVTLFDAARKQHIKVTYGLEEPIEQFTNNLSFQSMLSDVVLVIEDFRYFEDPQPGVPQVSFYAGVTLKTEDDEVLGTLCVLDKRPRTFTEEQRALIQDLARVIVDEIVLRRELAPQKRELNRPHTWYRQVVERSPDPVFTVDRQGRIRTWNQASFDHFGHTRKEALGLNILKLIPESGQLRMRRYIERVFENEQVENAVLEFRNKKDEAVSLITNLFPLQDENGIIRACLISGTRLPKAVFMPNDEPAAESETAPEEPEPAPTGLFELLNAPCFVVQDGQVVYANQQFKLWFDLETDYRFVHSPLAMWVPDSEIKDVTALVESTLTNPTMIHRVPTADGADRTVQASVSSIQYRGNEAALVIWHDVSELQAQLTYLESARNEAERMSRIKTSFLSNMSHEIRTPLTSIIGFADVLSENVSDENREFAEMIQASGQRLMHILNSVLDLAQLDGRSVELKYEPLDLTSHAREVLQLFRPQAEKRGLTLTFEAPDTPVRANLDHAALSRVLHNLIGNAIKFTNEGGVTVTVRKEGEYACLDVADTGIGISADFMDQMFDEFKQEFRKGAHSAEGSGLGLTITKRLVELMNGQILVESEEDVGSIFTIQFPHIVESESTMEIVEPESEPDPDVESELVEPGKPVVLIYEPREDTRILLEHLLRDQYGVEFADGKQDLLDKVKSGAFSAVLYDVQGTDFDSRSELLMALGDAVGHSGIPTIACTGYTFLGTPEQIMDAGFKGSIAKPFTRKRLFDVLGRVLQES